MSISGYISSRTLADHAVISNPNVASAHTINEFVSGLYEPSKIPLFSKESKSRPPEI